ncbi:MAG TPA: hypothetical protein VE643_02410, partial [Nitrososphaeraceae archaeon]|nr:hypothetical protein [Nitrososphaeraceae archaeon]
THLYRRERISIVGDASLLFPHNIKYPSGQWPSKGFDYSTVRDLMFLVFSSIGGFVFSHSQYPHQIIDSIKQI